MSEAAREIYQANLDAVSRALWDSDDETICRLIAVPHKITSSDAEVEITNVEEMLTAVYELRDSYRRLGARAYHRICDAAEFIDETHVQGRHRTFVLDGGTLVLPAYASEMTLELRDDVWVGTGIRSDIAVRDCTVVPPSLMARSSGGPANPQEGSDA